MKMFFFLTRSFRVYISFFFFTQPFSVTTMDREPISFIGQISTDKDTWKLKVRIVRLWKQSYQIDMILMDENGDKIQATIKKILMPIFENQLEEGSIILLSKFGVGEMNDKFPVIKHPYKLIFYRQTTVRRCQEFEGPLYGFRLVDFEDIINDEVELETTVDVIGYVVSTTDMDIFNRGGKESKRESKRISFDIVNLKGETLGCTLWDNYAQQFSTFLQGYLSDEVVIVLIQFGKVKNWKGKPNIQNAFFGSRLFINEDVEEISDFRNRLLLGAGGEGSLQIAAGPLSSQTVYSCREEFLKKNGRKYVEEIWDVTKETVCVVLGTIRSVEEDYGWFYVACTKCSKKVIPITEVGGLDDIDGEINDDDVGVLFCPKCKIRSPTVVPRFKVRVRVQDATGTISFVMFDKELSNIIGRSAYDIRDQQVKDGEENAWPRAVNQLIGKRFIFKIEISTYNLESKYSVYTVLKVCDDDEIISVMLEDDASTQDAIDVKDGESAKDESLRGFDVKEAVSYTGDSEVQTDVCHNDATSPHGKRALDDGSKDENGQTSSTKRRLVKVKVEKP